MKGRLVGALTFTLLAGASVSTQSDDTDAIRARLAAYAQAREQGDGAAQAAFYTEDADTWLSLTRKLSRGRVGNR
jgi:ketosteroid isomerase-like protein